MTPKFEVELVTPKFGILMGYFNGIWDIEIPIWDIEMIFPYPIEIVSPQFRLDNLGEEAKMA